jgi:hypothetical protein
LGLLCGAERLQKPNLKKKIAKKYLKFDQAFGRIPAEKHLNTLN